MAVGTVKIIDTVKVNGRDVGKLYNAPNGTFLRGLDFNTDWEYFGTKDVNGRRWYDLGGDQWISDEFASHAIKEVGVATGTCRVANFSSDFKAIVRNVPNGIPNGQKLDPNTEWAYNEYAIDQWDYKWFNLGHSQWATTQEVVDITNGGGSDTQGGWRWPFDKAYVGVDPDAQAQAFGHQPSFKRTEANVKDPWFHDGFDFGSVLYPLRTIKAIHSGKIIFAGDPRSQGIYGLGDAIVVQQVGNLNIVYQEFAVNNSDLSVQVGQTVNAGDTIGYFDYGASNSLGQITHLHLGITTSDWVASQRFAFDPDGPWLDPIKVIQNQGI